MNKVLLDAINKGASDIHFEPYEKVFRVRFRQDGVLREVAAPPIGLAPKISARLKVMARMDIAERRMPQDGRIKMSLSKNRAIDFRVNTCPTLFGEKIVCVSWTPAAPSWASTHWATKKNRRSSSWKPSTGRTAWSWSPARPAAARPSPCTRR